MTEHAEAVASRWQRTVAAERERRRDTAEQQRARRAAAFAADTGLPDPIHWLDTVTTGVPHTLAGAVA
ncbi:hypothetical protein ACFC1T_02330 [Kitasatospora sp. NPDC056076]|uniref:hypothetical protein n=1 Tax=Kitasatospora sp. NPDC056076 TaxID=3345703 RepID=UPI0035DD4C78